MRFPKSLVAALALCGIVLSSARSEAVIVERVVAVVGERPILLSELRSRARPFLSQIAASAGTPAQQAAAESEMFKELLDRMIDERLEEQAAEKAKLSVSAEEIDGAMANVATQARVSVRELVQEAKKRGLSEQEYRDEIRRQLLEGKLIQLRVRGRVRVTEEDARALYQHFLVDLAKEQPVDVRVLALRILPGSTDAQAMTRLALGAEIVSRARKGEDFCKLVESYTDDMESRTTCGSRGPQPFAALIPQLQEAIRTMQPGQVTDPIRIGGEAIVVVQLVSRSRVPTYEEAHDQLMNRAMNDAMERQRKAWIQDLRRGVYVDKRF
ncbi:MAG: SurA N-terminal domain-containing protein [Polyangiaceae bacterium]